jgi:DNA polymerase-3 subunit gamma/tau
LLLEVALIRATKPETDPNARGLLGRIERIERRLGIESTPAAPETPVPEEAPTPPRRASAPAPAATTRAASAPATESEAPTEPTEPAEAAEAPAPATPPSEVGYGHIKDAWPATMREVGKRSKRVGAFLKPSRPLSFDGESLAVEVQSDFHANQMAMDANRAILVEGLHAALGIRPTLTFAAQGKEPPAPEASSEDATDISEATSDTSDHDPIELIRKGLGAEIVEER